MKKTMLGGAWLGGACLLLCALGLSCSSLKTTVDYGTVSVPQEGGIKFEKITEESDDVITPNVRKRPLLEWWINSFIAISPDGARIAYINQKNNMSNVMVKSATQGGVSVQRTFRNNVQDVSWSPDGKTLCYSEFYNGQNRVQLVNADQGSVVSQISTGNTNDYSGVIVDMKSERILFHRGEGSLYNYSIWEYDRKTNLFSNYSRGMTPCPIPSDKDSYYCSRFTNKGLCEIWRVNPKTGVEEVVLSRPDQSFTTPKLSPDGKWLLCTGSSTGDNTDIYVIGTDGNNLTQLTYHPGNDISAVWSPDGKSIYFLSQRGNVEGKYNVWKMNFNLPNALH